MTYARIRDILLLRNVSGRDRRAVLMGMAVLLPALLWIAAVRPYRASVGELKDRIEAERSLLEREEALIASAAALPVAVDDARERANRAAMRLVRAANLPLAEAEVTGFLQDMAQRSRVLLQEVRSVNAPRGADDETGSLHPLRLALRGESDLEGVLTFLQRVENSPLLLRIAELSIEPAVRDDDEPRAADGVVLLTLVVHAYVPSDIERPSSTQEMSP